MKTESMQKTLPRWLSCLMTACFLCSGPLLAQVPVDENGNPIEAIDESTGPNADVDLAPDAEENLTAAELETLVGPIALYPDDLLAIVLPASAYPLQIVQAARFLEQLESDSSLEPDESWDPSVTALLNYPEVVKLMNEDIDWTYKLGEAVVRQQADIIAAVEAFRDRAYAAGNLKSDERQTVTNEDGVIEIEPVEEEIIYVPYYEPERVVVYQTQPVYHYYSRPCPVYYYPYPYGYSFASGYFWGVTTAFTIGWTSHHLHVYHPSYWGHPYYGRHYFGHYYRRPSISVYNTYYVNNHVRRSPHHFRDGDFWRPRRHGGARPGHDGYRADYYRDVRRERSEDGYRDRRDSRDVRQIATGNSRHAGRRAGFRNDTATASDNDTIRFRPRADVARRATDNDHATRRATDNDDTIRFRERERTADRSVPRTTRQDTRNDGNDRNNGGTVDSRSRSNGDVAVRSARHRTVERGFRSSSNSSRRESTVARPATRTHVAPSRATQSAPRSVSPRAAMQRSAPRTSVPRSAPRPSANPPAATSQQAPSRESRAAPRRSSSSNNDSARRRVDQR